MNHCPAVAYVPSEEHGVVVFVGGFQSLGLRRERQQSEVIVEIVAHSVGLCGAGLGHRLQTVSVRRHRDRQTDRQTDRQADRQRQRERTQNSDLYYSRIEILGRSLFLQSVLAKLHRQYIYR